MKQKLYSLLVLMMGTVMSWGQISIGSLPYSPSVTNFNSFNPSSSGNLSSTIPSGWTASSAATPAYLGQTSNPGATGGYYGLGSAGDFSIGALRSGGTGNITYSVSFTNGSGTTINSITLSWDYKQFRYANTSGWDCSGTGQLTGNATLNGKDFTGSASGTNGTPTTTGVASFNLTGLSIANGQSFGITWVTTAPGGSNNAISIDNFSISATGSSCTAPSQASGVTLSNPTASQIQADWTAAGGDGTMIVVRPTAQSSTAPSSGTSYTPNTDYSLAGQINTNNRVVFRAAGTTVTTTNLTPATQYTVTAYEYNSTGDCYNLTSPSSATGYTLSSEPTTHAAAFNSAAASPTSINLTFSAASTITNAAGYIILQRTGAVAPTGTPTDATGYAVSNVIGDGTVAAIITNTASTSTTINSLSPSTNYSFTLIPYGYNGSVSATYNYYTAATIPSTTAMTNSLAAPTVTSPTATAITTNTATLGGNVTSDGGDPVTARGVVWSETGVNANPQIGGGGVTNVVGSGTTGVFTVGATSLPVATQISYAAYATNAIGTSYSTVGTFYTLTTAPTTPSSAVTITSFSTNSIGISWTSGNGTGRIVVARPAATAATAPAGGTDYNVNSASFVDGLNGTTATNNVVVYKGTGSSVTITGLSAATNYSFDVYDYNGAAQTINYTTAATGTRYTLAAEPVTAATGVNFTNVTGSGMTINWTAGSGTNHLIVVKATSAVDTDPTDGTNYSAGGNVFGAGSQLGTGNYVVYRATLNTIAITGLTNGTTYHVAVYSFNGNTATSENYLLSTPATGSQLAATPVYYSQGSVSPSTLANWNTNPAGGGTTPSNFTSGDFVIQNGHSMTTSGAWAIGATGFKLQIQNGGMLTANNNVTINSGATLQIDNGGTYIHNNTGTPSTTIFNGTESFGASSNVRIDNWVGNTTSLITGVTLPFGNLEINWTSLSTNWQQTMTGAINLCAGNFTITSTGTGAYRLTASGTPTVAIAGDFSMASGKVDFNSSTGTGTIQVAGNFLQTGGTLTTAGSNNGILNLTGTAKNVRMAAAEFINVNFTSTASYTQTGAINFDGLTAPATTLTIASGGSLDMGNFQIAAGSAGTMNVTINGTIKTANLNGLSGGASTAIPNTNAPLVTFGSNAVVEYNGSGAQAITGSSIPNLTINNAAGATLNLSMNTTNLVLTNGTLNTGNNTLTVTGTITGGSSSSYVRTNGSSGGLRRNVSSTDVAFPVGNTAYNPATLNNSGTADDFTLRVGDDLTDGGTSGTTVFNPAVQRTWFIDEGTPTGSNVSLTLQWASGQQINSFDLNHVYIVHHNGTAWQDYLGGTQPYQVPAANSLGGGLYNVTQTGITSFSPFGVASDGISPLLLQIGDINAVNKGVANEISWNTRTEDAGDKMELQSSTDAQTFATLADIRTKGSNSTYSYTDAQAKNGTTYYRLRMTDAASKLTYSKVVSANKKVNGTISVYPNPVTDVLTVNATQQVNVTISDLSGKKILYVANASMIDMSLFAAGTYILTVTDAAGNSLKTEKLNKAK